MLKKKTVSQCPSADWCKGYNAAIDAAQAQMDALTSRCQAAQQDLEELMGLTGLKVYETCAFCTGQDDYACVRHSPPGRCSAKWRGPREHPPAPERTGEESRPSNASALQEKYGSELVMVSPAAALCSYFPEPFTPIEMSPFALLALKHPEPMLRFIAEEDPSFRQHVVYMTILDKRARKIYTTYRKGGDTRLLGQYSIGIGGHMEPGDKSWTQALNRELEEELMAPALQISPDELPHGFICSSLSPVDRVHIGIVYIMQADSRRCPLAIRESNKLSGQWMDLSRLKALSDAGALESWSQMVLEEILRKIEEEESSSSREI